MALSEPGLPAFIKANYGSPSGTFITSKYEALFPMLIVDKYGLP